MNDETTFRFYGRFQSSETFATREEAAEALQQWEKDAANHGLETVGRVKEAPGGEAAGDTGETS